MCVNVVLYVSAHKWEVLQSLEQHEVKNGGNGNATEDTNLITYVLGNAKRKDDTSKVLNKWTKDKGYGHTEEDTHDHL